MTSPLSIEQLARLRSTARRLATQAADTESDMRRLLSAARLSLQDTVATLSFPATVTQESIDAMSNALRDQMLRTEAGIDQARRLCLLARQHQLATDQLVKELGISDERRAADRNAVVVADDIEPIRELLAKALGDAGFMVRTAANGLEAVIAAYELRPAVIVMDMRMPVLDGLEATRLIKSIDDLQEAHVIAYTATPPLPTAQCREMFSFVLNKPSPPELVVAAVRRCASGAA